MNDFAEIRSSDRTWNFLRPIALRAMAVAAQGYFLWSVARALPVGGFTAFGLQSVLINTAGLIGAGWGGALHNKLVDADTEHARNAVIARGMVLGAATALGAGLLVQPASIVVLGDLLPHRTRTELLLLLLAGLGPVTTSFTVAVCTAEGTIDRYLFADLIARITLALIAMLCGWAGFALSGELWAIMLAVIPAMIAGREIGSRARNGLARHSFFASKREMIDAGVFAGINSLSQLVRIAEVRIVSARGVLPHVDAYFLLQRCVSPFTSLLTIWNRRQWTQQRLALTRRHVPRSLTRHSLLALSAAAALFFVCLAALASLIAWSAKYSVLSVLTLSAPVALSVVTQLLLGELYARNAARNEAWRTLITQGFILAALAGVAAVAEQVQNRNFETFGFLLVWIIAGAGAYGFLRLQMQGIKVT